jgi:hypothetical protein
VSLVDQTTTARQAFSFLAPALVTPADSETVSQFFPGDFSTTFDWQTSFSLPVLFQRSWRITPSVGVANKTGQAFAIRNRETGGAWVFQGKRFLFGVNSTPTLFGFYPGFGPLSRIRHSFSPIVQFNYSPAASVPEAFAAGHRPAGATACAPGRAHPDAERGNEQHVRGKNQAPAW